MGGRKMEYGSFSFYSHQKIGVGDWYKLKRI